MLPASRDHNIIIHMKSPTAVSYYYIISWCGYLIRKSSDMGKTGIGWHTAWGRTRGCPLGDPGTCIHYLCQLIIIQGPALRETDSDPWFFSTMKTDPFLNSRITSSHLTVLRYKTKIASQWICNAKPNLCRNRIHVSISPAHSLPDNKPTWKTKLLEERGRVLGDKDSGE